MGSLGHRKGNRIKCLTNPGLSFDPRNGKWRARITLAPKKTISLGYFANREDAVAARQKAELHYFGEIAKRK